MLTKQWNSEPLTTKDVCQEQVARAIKPAPMSPDPHVAVVADIHYNFITLEFAIGNTLIIDPR
jgi:hypothetical protein